MSEQLARVLRQSGELPEDGAELLNDTRDFLRRFCAFPDGHCLTAVTLWAVHTHAVEHFHTTPRLAILSPEAGSGKTRVLEVLDLLVATPLFTLNASPAAVFRTLASERITLLFDECDSIWSKRGKDDNHEDLRALLNAGYKIGATIPRCVGPRHDVVRFSVFCAAALAGLGDLPDTIMSRAVIIRMRRRAPHEKLEPFRSREHDSIGHGVRDRLAAWAGVIGQQAGTAWPALPRGVVDRPAEVWEPLLAIAEAAGGDWPANARAACVALCKVAENREASLGVRLLADIRQVFGERNAIHSETLLRLLTSEDAGLDDDAPWADLYGKALSKRQLATMLGRYGVRPQKVSVDGRNLQGYQRAALWDAWIRYLPPSDTPAEAEHPEHPESARPTGPPAVPKVPVVPFEADADRRNGTAAPRVNTGVIPHVPEVPDLRGTETAQGGGPRWRRAACPRCAGEGCAWCHAGRSSLAP